VTAPAAAGVLLTGGRSRRLGADKASLLLDGETLAARAEGLLRSVCGRAVEVGRGASGLRAVLEQPPGSGPLAALAAGGEELRAQGHRGPVLLVAVDLPRLDRAILELLRDWPGEPTAVPSWDGRLQHACARYAPEAIDAARSLLAGGVRSLRALLDVIEHDVIGDDVWRRVASADVFADVDTRQDAARLGIELPG
jgi:molybdopterin-guanine dinucleotide biosynthesis protein A